MNIRSNLTIIFAEAAGGFRHNHRLIFNSLAAAGAVAAAIGVSAGAVALGLPFWAPGAIAAAMVIDVVGSGGGDHF